MTKRAVNARVLYTGRGLEFKSEAGQIWHSVANSSPMLQNLRR